MEVEALYADLQEAEFNLADTVEQEMVMAKPEPKPKPMRVQDVPSLLKDLKARATAELGTMSSLYRILKCLPYAQEQSMLLLLCIDTASL